VAHYVRGQYDGDLDIDGVEKDSSTETYAALRLYIDNWRWEGVPIYLRSGKALWKRGTEIVVTFKKAPEVVFRGTPVAGLDANRLIFHIQPYQGIEIQFQAKSPGMQMRLQPVHMKFSYGEAFRASRYTGYEVTLYGASHGDATLFSRGDLVVAAWRIAQPILDCWAQTPPTEFPNYIRSTWGPKAAAEMIAADGRRWFEVVTEDVLKQSPLFKDGDPVFLDQVLMALVPRQVAAGEVLIRKGDSGCEMFLIEQGEVEVLDDAGGVRRVLNDGDVFGEIGLLDATPRSATVRARIPTDLYVLPHAAFQRILRDNPQFATAIRTVAKDRYNVQIE
jgi:glucose-6-phosphate 1-dehydrogenase